MSRIKVYFVTERTPLGAYRADFFRSSEMGRVVARTSGKAETIAECIREVKRMAEDAGQTAVRIRR